MGTFSEWRGLGLLDAIHVGGRGMVVFAERCADGHWRELAVPARKAVSEAAEREGNRDQYFSVAQFKRGRRGSDQVMSFGAVAFDLDMPGIDPEKLAADVLAFIRTTKIPEPAAIVVTGKKGIHLWWLFERRIPAAADSRRRRVVSQLVTTLKRFGADPACVDAARVMRLPGSIHGETGLECRVIHWTEARVDFEDFFAAVMPFGRSELEHKRKTLKASQKVKPSQYARSSIVNAVERLAEHRGGFKEGIRNKAVFIAATEFAATAPPGGATAASVSFGRRTTDLPESDMRNCAASALRKRRQDGRGYRYSRSRIARELEITPEEIAAIPALAPARTPDERRAADAVRKCEARRKAGAFSHAKARERRQARQAACGSVRTYNRRRKAAREHLREALRRRVSQIRPQLLWRSPCLRVAVRWPSISYFSVVPELTLCRTRGPP
jgi:hypothetical protein